MWEWYEKGTLVVLVIESDKLAGVETNPVLNHGEHDVSTY